MAVYGYHRTSTTEQHLDRGIKAIKDYCAAHQIELSEIYTDQQTGKNFDRPEYQFLRKRIQKGDVLILSELDRLGRNKEQTLKELRFFKDKGIRVMVLEIPTTLIDYNQLDNGQSLSSMMLETISNMLIEMYAVLAQAEMEKRVKRQSEGIQSKRDRGEWADYGRPAVMTLEQFKIEYKRVQDGLERPVDCMRRLGMTKPTFYRYKSKIEIKI